MRLVVHDARRLNKDSTRLPVCISPIPPKNAPLKAPSASGYIGEVLGHEGYSDRHGGYSF